MLALLGLMISTKTDSRALGRYIQVLRSGLGLKAKEFEMYKRTPPAEDSVGVETLQ